MTSQTLPTHPNRSGVKIWLLLHVSWHDGWKPVRNFPSFHVNRKTEHLKGHYHSHCISSLFIWYKVEEYLQYSTNSIHYITTGLSADWLPLFLQWNTHPFICTLAQWACTESRVKVLEVGRGQGSVNHVWNSTMQRETACCGSWSLKVGPRAKINK